MNLNLSAKKRASNAKKLIAAAKQVIYDAERAPLKRLSRKQEEALMKTLRFLDLSREYEIGYTLRQAFGVEVTDERGKI